MHIDDARIIVNSMDGNIWYLDEANKRVIRKATEGIAVRRIPPFTHIFLNYAHMLC